MKIKALLLSGLFLTVFFLQSQAAYLKNVPQRLVQPDGTILNCFATGDEFHNWLHDANNYTIVQDHATGFYVYATKSGSALVPTTLIPDKSDPAAANLKPGLNLDPAEILRLTKDKFKIPALKGSTGETTTGTINNIVIFIRFADQTEFPTGMSTYNSAFNNSVSVSMVQYFLAESKSQLTINTTMYPSNGGSGAVVSYQDTNPRNYYCKYDATTNPTGYKDDSERQTREMTLVKNAALSVQSQLESSGLDFDNDNDGRIDNVCYIVQGATQGWNDLLWPHMWALFQFDVRISGARIWNFNFQLSNSFGVSVLCHEMSHSIGFPDLYRYVNSDISPVGKWDVMGSNTNPPQQHTVYTKEKYGKWFSGIPEISTDGTYTLSPLSTDGYAAYKIKSPNSTSEYFVVEYRKTEGMFETALPGSGLIIYRVSPSVSGNSQGPPDEIYVFRPNGTATVNGDINSAYFSAGSGRTSFTSTTNPACVLSNGSPGAIEITNIGSAGATISFNVAIKTPMAVLNVSPATREIGMQGASTFFDVTNTGGGDMAWTAEVTAGSSWLHITSGSSGTNRGSIVVQADLNNDHTIRIGVVTVTAAGAAGTPQTVSVTQLADPPILNITPDFQSIGCDGGNGSISVTNSGTGTMAWSAAVTTGATWLHITSGTSGGNNGTVSFTADGNLESSVRNGVITVSANGADGSPKIFSVTQAGNPPVMMVVPDTIKFGYRGGIGTYEIINTGRGAMPWVTTVTSGSSWIHILSDLTGSDYSAIDMSTDFNPQGLARSGVITVSSGIAIGSPKTVTVLQAANTALGTGTGDLGKTCLAVYPNPAQNSLTIGLEGVVNPDAKLVITDMLGRMVYSGRCQDTGNFQTTIDVSNWTRGCYQISADTGDQLMHRLVILN